MSVEFSAVCVEQPDLQVIGRAAEVWLANLVGLEAPVAVENHEVGASVRLGGSATAFAYMHSPGTHEYADSWVLTLELGGRLPLDWLLAAVFAAAGGVLYRGRFLDEECLLTPGLTASSVLLTAARAGPATAEVVVRALRSQD